MAKGIIKSKGYIILSAFSPVAKLVTVHVLLAVASARQWSIHQIDINNAFLHGYLDDDVYMVPPQGYDKAKLGQVCKFLRSLYGFKQEGRQWNVELCCKLQDYGFIQSSSDHCLYL